MGVPRVASLSCTAVAATWAWQSGPVKRWDGMVQWVEHNRPSLGLIITSTYVSCIICIHIIIYTCIYITIYNIILYYVILYNIVLHFQIYNIKYYIFYYIISYYKLY